MAKLWEWILSIIGQGAMDYASDNGPLGARYPNHTPLGRLIMWSFQSLVVLSGVILGLVFLRGLVMFRYLSYLYQIDANVPDLFRTAVDTKLTVLSVLTLLCLAVYIYSGWHFRPRPFRFSTTIIARTILALFSLALIAPFSQKALYRFIESEAHYRVVLLMSSEQYEEAAKILNPLANYAVDSEIRFDATLRLTEVASLLKEYERSIEARLQLINQNIDGTSQDDLFKLQSDLFSYSREIGISEAVSYIELLKHRYPKIDTMNHWTGASPLSPIWLGISPWNYQVLYADDMYSIGSVSLDDRAILQSLIEQYPEDDLVDWGRLVLGEHEELASQDSKSRVLDWALYKTGLSAYLETNYAKCTQYYILFIEEFPGHRLADDAAYRAARCFEMAAQYAEALDYALIAQELPDGDYHYLIEPYSLALMDYYFNSEELAAFIKQYESRGSNLHLLPVLKYSFAEQLFKEEDYHAARAAFQQIMSEYPTQEVADYADHNLEIIEDILRLTQAGGSEFPLRFAEYLLRTPEDWSPQTTVFYNDLYEGRRTVGMQNIDVKGPSFSYFEQNNDYLRAVELLQEFIMGRPDTEAHIEAQYWSIIGFYYLSLDGSFLPSNVMTTSQLVGGDHGSLYTLKQQRSEEEKSYIKLGLLSSVSDLLVQYPQSRFTPEAVSVAALALRNIEDSLLSIEYMQLVVTHYPDHRLANNALIYVARQYYAESRLAPTIDIQIQLMKRAESVYERVIREYPIGHVAQEASQELDILRSRLSQLE
jgi:outer membrane protein assembly factor BamD (BamD/ComL family)